MVNDLEIPTIGVINGPGFYTEMLLMCDITICSEDAIIYDLHYDIGTGSGQSSTFHEFVDAAQLCMPTNAVKWSRMTVTSSLSCFSLARRACSAAAHSAN